MRLVVRWSVSVSLKLVSYMHECTVFILLVNEVLAALIIKLILASLAY